MLTSSVLYWTADRPRSEGRNALDSAASLRAVREDRIAVQAPSAALAGPVGSLS